MNQWNYQQGHHISFGPRGISRAIKQIIAANVVVFILTQLTGIGFWAQLLGLNPALVLTKLHIWQPFTYMFVHAGLWHLGLNMLMLWMFGSELERLWGGREFLRFYFVTGVGAGLFSMVPYTFNLLAGFQGYVPSIIGASGAVYGILLAYALTYPDRTVYVYFIMPVKVKYLMLFMGFVTFMSVGNGDGISHITHLGGLLVAWVYLRRGGRYRGLNIPWKLWINKLFSIRFLSDKPPKKRGRGQWHRVDNRESLRREMDVLLDKITRVGYEALSNNEKERLLYLSSQLSDKGQPQG